MRIARGLAALLALALSLVGLPVALVLLGGDVWPDRLSWSGLLKTLTAPDDGTVIVALLTVVGWLAWVVFAVSVGIELAALTTGRQVRVSLPGLAGPRRLAASMLIAVIGAVSTPAVAHGPLGEPVTHAVESTDQNRPWANEPVGSSNVATLEHDAASTAASPSGSTDGVVHEVRRGDDLWSLAERYYGSGPEWRRIARANPDRLTGGPDRLEPGWRLVIPGGSTAEPVTEHASVVVQAGDTLSSIAEDELGDDSQWPALFRANRAELSDPDAIDAGMRLRLPDVATAHSDEAEVGKKSRPPSQEPSAPDGLQHPSADRPVDTDPAEPPVSTETGAPTAPATQPASQQPPVEAPAGADRHEVTDAVNLQYFAAVGGLMAAGVLGGLAARRRVQLQARPLGRKLAPPPEQAQVAEVALGRVQRPLSLRTLDRASRAIAAHCHATSAVPPALLYARVGEDALDLVLERPSRDAPVGFTVSGRAWQLSRTDAAYVNDIPGMSDATRPWPALVTVGHDGIGAPIVADLETLGLLELRADDPTWGSGVLAAMAVELSFSPWAEEMFLTVVGPASALPDALGQHNVVHTRDVDELLTRLEQRAAIQRRQAPLGRLGQHRIDPDLADPWAPEIILVDQPLTASQQERLAALVIDEPRVTIAAVVAGPFPRARWSLVASDGTETTARLMPLNLRLVPQRLGSAEMAAVVDLVATTGTELTVPAPWWHDAPDPPDPPPDNVTFLGRRAAGGEVSTPTVTSEEGSTMQAAPVASRALHPTLHLLGPIDLVGAAGNPPPRAGKQCLEYCAWLLEHPGTTAQAMAAGLFVAEGTRRSNMSRLRGWLGADPEGRPYLPDAYTGNIALHPAVSSDWQRLQMITAAGVNRTSSGMLRTALGLVRGAPLADAAPGQWHWAEELRTDMISCIRDIGVELASRALADHDIDLARWAASRALAAAPGDELLLATRIRTEHQAGNRADTERLTLQLAAQARTLGVDLDPGTVELLQQVVEGQVRARMA